MNSTIFRKLAERPGHLVSSGASSGRIRAIFLKSAASLALAGRRSPAAVRSRRAPRRQIDRPVPSPLRRLPVFHGRVPLAFLGLAEQWAAKADAAA
ncbi:hypothetical protein E0493_19810 [Roseomonas sp. M0104]|uniref:Uncharacterized protein n=1 Tax=Teichococcus coralli TaxID=2545983 RepID=A0A845BFG8_9PROT|nr:hypothetical protein [Pseudoroseomonas coralli]MXP65598.1 hypothetical protein [Pseudoroseomonas coralli]